MTFTSFSSKISSNMHNKRRRNVALSSLISIMVLFMTLMISPQNIQAQPFSPKFPASFTSQIEFIGKRHYSWDFYIDSDMKQYRIDSYGVPMGAQGRHRRHSPHGHLEQNDPEKRALYVFIYNYTEHQLYSFMPQVESDEYSCSVLKTPYFKMFPSLLNSGILDMMTYVGKVDSETHHSHYNKESTPATGSVLDYWSLDFGGLFNLDLMLDEKTQLPNRLSISSDELHFVGFNGTKPDDSVWQFPPHTGCQMSSHGWDRVEKEMLFPESMMKMNKRQ